MSTDLILILENIEKEKGISRDILVESIESALVSAVKKMYHDKEKDVQVKIDLEAGVYKIIADGKEIGTKNFGRIEAQTAKQVIFQKIKEAERDVIYGEFQHKTGSIVSGMVYRFEKGAILVDLGKTEAVLPKRELSPRDAYRQGDSIRAYLLEASRTARGPQIVLSRSHPNFVKCLFEMEVPEIADGTVEILSVSREAGDRTKIAVYSKNQKIDSVGACVGIKGSRVKGVVRELQGEKIDIIPWSENSEDFIREALSPAKAGAVKILNVEERKAEVVVSDDQLSLAIGKNGQNVRLASKLTGWSIDIRSSKDVAKEKLESSMAESAEVSDVLGSAAGEEKSESVDPFSTLGPKAIEALKVVGISDWTSLSAKSKEEILAIEGLGKRGQNKIFKLLGIDKEENSSDSSGEVEGQNP